MTGLDRVRVPYQGAKLALLAADIKSGIVKWAHVVKAAKIPLE